MRNILTTAGMKYFDTAASEMKQHGLSMTDDKVYLKLNNSEHILREAFSHFLKKENRKAEWLPEYAEVAQWLAGNNGRGLFLFGGCGRGKTLLCKRILPAILLLYYRKVVSVFDVQQMNSNIDYALSRHIISLDDIGTEEISNSFGNKRLAFAEIMDAVEKQDKLVIVSTNLTAEDIRRRYGDRVMDRIKATTQRVLFAGESLRR